MSVARFRVGLLAEVLTMAVATLRTNKLRSALTVLGVVIGVTSIVGMTSLVRGFGDQFESMIRTMGADTVYVAKFSISSFASGKEFWDLMRRPDVNEGDAAAIKIRLIRVSAIRARNFCCQDSKKLTITPRHLLQDDSQESASCHTT